MAKKKITHLQKASILLKFSIFLAKLKKPITPMLVSLKKSRKLNPYDHYSWYVKEYEFSPSNTPLIGFDRRFKKGRIDSFRKVYSNFVVISECFGLRKQREMGWGGEENGVVMSSSRELMVIDLSESSENDDYYSSSVDERAERFIQRFYEDIRKQRQESHLQIMDV